MGVSFLRYPGGKSRVVNRILPSILQMQPAMGGYCEPFVGGGSVALATASTLPVGTRIWLNDANPDVAAIWRSLSSGKANAVIERLRSMRPSVSLFRKLTASRPRNMVDRAAKFIALNRMSFSGKTHTTPIGGWKQTGKWKVDVEWRIEHVVRNISLAAGILSRHETIVTSRHFRDALVAEAAMYLDPPYYERGRTMYPVAMKSQEHEELASRLPECKRWVLSYDDCPEVRALYRGHKMSSLGWVYSAAGKLADGDKRGEGRELLILSRGAQ